MSLLGPLKKLDTLGRQLYFRAVNVALTLSWCAGLRCYRLAVGRESDRIVEAVNRRNGGPSLAATLDGF